MLAFRKVRFLFTVQLDSGQYQEQSQEYVGWKEFSDKLATQLRQSVRIS